MIRNPITVWPRALCLVAGFALPLAFAPYDQWWLAPLLVAVPINCWLTSRPGLAAGAGFAFGAGAFLAGTYWLYISIHVFGKTPLWIAVVLMLGLVLIMAVYYALAGAAVARYAGARPSNWLLVLVVASVWSLAEWLRGWILTGFPWLSLGYSQLNSPLSGFAPLGGAYLVSFLVVVSSAYFIVAARCPGAQRVTAIGAVALVYASGFALTRIDWTEASGPPLRATLIQGGISQDRKWLPEQRGPTMTIYRDLTLENLDSTIIVWPEVAIPAARQSIEPYLQEIGRRVAAAGSGLALGILDYDRESESYFNSMISLGRSQAIYRKRHLVPFGEFFPVPDFVREWMRLRSLPSSDMTPGVPDQPPVPIGGHAAAVTICYEDAFAAEQLHFFPEAVLIVNISNDAWFGDSIAPHHHLDIARMRSLESGRWQLRATNTGITAFIDPRGTVAQASPQFEISVLTMMVEPRNGMTPYLRIGNWPLVLFCSLCLGVMEARRLIRNPPDRTPGPRVC